MPIFQVSLSPKITSKYGGNPVEVFSWDLAKDRQRSPFVYGDGASVLSLELGTWNVLKKKSYY